MLTMIFLICVTMCAAVIQYDQLLATTQLLKQNNDFVLVTNFSTLFYPDNSSFSPPWLQNGTVSALKVWRSEQMDNIVATTLLVQVAGLQVSFRDVLMLLAQKMQVYLIGGLVRDSALGNPANDVDIAFSGTANEVIAICQAKWGNQYCFQSSRYISIGDTDTTDYIEGFNVGYSLYAEPTSRDFSMNALYYDLTNNVTIDVTGIGVNDTLELFLRPPVKDALWPAWSYNPWGGLGSKLLRYYKFRVREYTPASATIAQFIASSLQLAFDNDAYVMEGFAVKNLGSLLDGQPPVMCISRLSAWRAILTQDLGEQWYNDTLRELEKQFPCTASPMDPTSWNLNNLSIILIALLVFLAVVAGVAIFCAVWKKE